MTRTRLAAALSIAALMSPLAAANFDCDEQAVPECAPNPNCMISACWHPETGAPDQRTVEYRCYTPTPLRKLSPGESMMVVPTEQDRWNVVWGFRLELPTRECWDREFPLWYTDAFEKLVPRDVLPGEDD